MELYILIDQSNEIHAHSRFKELADSYMGGSEHKLSMVCITKEQYPDKKERAIIILRTEEMYQGKSLTSMKDLPDVVRECDEDKFSIADEEYGKLLMLTKDLKNIIDNYDLKGDDIKTLKKASKVLNKLTKRDNFVEAMGMDLVQRIVKENPSLDLDRIFVTGGRKSYETQIHRY